MYSWMYVCESAVFLEGINGQNRRGGEIGDGLEVLNQINMWPLTEKIPIKSVLEIFERVILPTFSEFY